MNDAPIYLRTKLKGEDLGKGDERKLELAQSYVCTLRIDIHGRFYPIKNYQ